MLWYCAARLVSLCCICSIATARCCSSCSCNRVFCVGAAWPAAVDCCHGAPRIDCCVIACWMIACCWAILSCCCFRTAFNTHKHGHLHAVTPWYAPPHPTHTNTCGDLHPASHTHTQRHTQMAVTPIDPPW